MDVRTVQAAALLQDFTARTQAGPRYLWTDAFAVCTLLGLQRATGDSRHGEQALRLVDRVHHVLGRHRPDEVRTGWISGLADADGEAHPTCGGLRIGKPLPERAPDDVIDERLEWDRDGQYFHYLTKWMHALDQTTRATGQSLFSRWARELAERAHHAFTYVPPGGGAPRMYWKMSIDLTRPLVTSMGQHDALDGLVTCLQLDASASPQETPLEGAIADFGRMLDVGALVTSDPLGLGGLLHDACRLAQLSAGDVHVEPLIEVLLTAARDGLRDYVSATDLGEPAHRRLAFRELGLSIGLAALESTLWSGTSDRVRARLAELGSWNRLRTQIESFWLAPSHRRGEHWRAHQDINDVMLAASLAPEGFVVLRRDS